MDSQLFLKNFEALRSINEKLRDIPPEKYQYLNPSNSDSQTSNQKTQTWEHQSRRFVVMPSALLRDKKLFSDLEDKAYKNFDRKFEGPFEIREIID